MPAARGHSPSSHLPPGPVSSRGHGWTLTGASAPPSFQPRLLASQAWFRKLPWARGCPECLPKRPQPHLAMWASGWGSLDPWEAQEVKSWPFRFHRAGRGTLAWRATRAVHPWVLTGPCGLAPGARRPPCGDPRWPAVRGSCWGVQSLGSASVCWSPDVGVAALSWNPEGGRGGALQEQSLALVSPGGRV